MILNVYSVILCCIWFVLWQFIILYSIFDGIVLTVYTMCLSNFLLFHVR